MERKKISRETAKLQLELLRRAQSEEARGSNPTTTDWAYWKAAAVLSEFHPGHLLPVGIRGVNPGAGYTHILPVSERLPRDGKLSQWRLQRKIRGQALDALGNRTEMKKALFANSDRPEDPVQKALEALIMEQSVDFSELPADVIAGYLTAADWLRPVLSNIPSQEILLRYSSRAKLVAPFHELVGDHFVGRESSLRRLRSYVGSLPSERESWKA